MSELREYTMEEVRDKFLTKVEDICKYWRNVDLKSTRGEMEDEVMERIEGAVFSVLSTLDGCAGDLPAFVVAPYPDESDKEYYIEQGENFYAENHNVNCDIGGGLHELFRKERKV